MLCSPLNAPVEIPRLPLALSPPPAAEKGGEGEQGEGGCATFLLLRSCGSAQGIRPLRLTLRGGAW